MINREALVRNVIAYCVLLCILIGASAARSEDKMDCRPLAASVDALMSGASRVGATPIPLTGPRAEAFLDVMNAEPPETDIKSSLVLVILLQDGTSMTFVRQGDLLCGYWAMGEASTEKALKRAAGASKS